jgi:hypothetical protein
MIRKMKHHHKIRRKLICLQRKKSKLLHNQNLLGTSFSHKKEETTRKNPHILPDRIWGILNSARRKKKNIKSILIREDYTI